MLRRVHGTQRTVSILPPALVGQALTVPQLHMEMHCNSSSSNKMKLVLWQVHSMQHVLCGHA
jgi:hypothetical protein